MVIMIGTEYWLITWVTNKYFVNQIVLSHERWRKSFCFDLLMTRPHNGFVNRKKNPRILIRHDFLQLHIVPEELGAPHILALPDQTRFSLVNFPLHLPLELLGIEKYIQVLQCVILEQKVKHLTLAAIRLHIQLLTTAMLVAYCMKCQLSCH